MFETEVKTKDGLVKRVVAGSQEELDEAVKVVKNDQQAVSPDLHGTKDANKIVSPDNLAVEPPYVQPADPEVSEPDETKVPVKVKSSKK